MSEDNLPLEVHLACSSCGRELPKQFVKAGDKIFCTHPIFGPEQAVVLEIEL